MNFSFLPSFLLSFVIFITYVLCIGIGTKNTDLSNRLITENLLPSAEEVTSLIDCYRFCVQAQDIECVYISYHEDTNMCNRYSSFNDPSLGTYQKGWSSFTLKAFSSTKGQTSPSNSGYVTGSQGTYSYKIYFGQFSHGDAESGCSLDGAKLIRIDNAEKQFEVAAQLSALYISSPSGNKYVVIEGERNKTDSVFRFRDGTDITYFPWGLAQPDSNGANTLLVMNAEDDGKWYNVRPNGLFSYICEK